MPRFVVFPTLRLQQPYVRALASDLGVAAFSLGNKVHERAHDAGARRELLGEALGRAAEAAGGCCWKENRVDNIA